MLVDIHARGRGVKRCNEIFVSLVSVLIYLLIWIFIIGWKYLVVSILCSLYFILNFKQFQYQFNIIKWRIIKIERTVCTAMSCNAIDYICYSHNTRFIVWLTTFGCGICTMSSWLKCLRIAFSKFFDFIRLIYKNTSENDFWKNTPVIMLTNKQSRFVAKHWTLLQTDHYLICRDALDQSLHPVE